MVRVLAQSDQYGLKTGHRFRDSCANSFAPLGRQAAERKASKDTESLKKIDWEHKKVRQRKRCYCCQCGKKQGLDKGYCTVCGHGPKACLDCLASGSQ